MVFIYVIVCILDISDFQKYLYDFIFWAIVLVEFLSFRSFLLSNADRLLWRFLFILNLLVFLIMLFNFVIFRLFAAFLLL